MGKKLFVGSLNFTTTSEDLQRLFSPHGAVESAEVVADRGTGRSRGFGFVEMASDEEAQAAIKALHNTEVDGRTIAVEVAAPIRDRAVNRGRGGYDAGRSGGGGGAGGFGGGRGGGFSRGRTGRRGDR